MKLKALAAGLALAMGAGTAHAGIVQGNTSGTFGEMFLNVWDGTNTFSFDTGLTVHDFLNLTPTQIDALQWNFGADPNWSSFQGNPNLKWNFYGANTGVGISTGTLNEWGFVTTIQGGSAAFMSSSFGVTGYNNLASKIGDQAGNINQSIGNFTGTDNLSGFHADQTPADYENYGDNFQGGFGTNKNEFTVGDYADFAWFGRDKVSGTFANPVKKTFRDFLTVNLTTDGVLRFEAAPTTAVPLPAAAWLVGPALAGLFGFSRRRVAA